MLRDVIIAIPQGIRRCGVISQLQANHWTVHAQVFNRHDLTQAIRQTPQAVVLMSVCFDAKHMSGLLRTLLRDSSRPKVILWCDVVGCAVDFRFRYPTIQGFFCGRLETKELLQACTVAALGRRYLSPAMAVAFKRYRDKSDEHECLKGLSSREQQIFRMISYGMTVAEISLRLVISRKTVNTFRYRLFKKLNVTGDVQLAHLAVKYGLVDPATIISATLDA